VEVEGACPGLRLVWSPNKGRPSRGDQVLLARGDILADPTKSCDLVKRHKR